jgi:hypothetical protein
MAVSTETLSEFLLARIAEDEEVARDTYAASPWHAEGYYVMNHGVITETDEASTTAHMARWHPARVLAECEAKRRIVEHHDDDDDAGRCTACEPMMWARPTPFPCPTLRLLALPYADHPDYRREWRP